MKLHPRTWSRRSIATILALGLLLGGAVAAAAIIGGGGESNAVVVVNTKDGTSESKAGVKVAHDATDSVDNGNAAVAESSCTNCRSVAVAAQVVLVERNANAELSKLAS